MTGAARVAPHTAESTAASATPASVALAGLRLAMRDDGGLAERAGGAFSPGASAWAALALARTREGGAAALQAAGRLARAQQPDGRVPVADAHPDAVWPTPLALLAWLATDSFPDHRSRAERFLLDISGVVGDTDDQAVVGHDIALRGWPWILGTHSWVEPTALTVIALRRAGHAAHQRVAEGVRLLLDRQLSRGGWNYGNTTVYGTELVPQLDATGAALAALAGLVPAGEVSQSITRLEAELPGVATPLTLSWGIIGLSAWGRRPPESAAWVERSLAIAGRYGGYTTTHLAMLLAAADTARGFGP